jgi:hypothetical protein
VFKKENVVISQEFETDLQVLQNFFPVYCHDKHNHQIEKDYTLKYNMKEYKFKTSLCEECHALLAYSLQRLQECPHNIKPKCRKCHSPCYNKSSWKALANLMKYSGIKLGYIEIKNKLTNLLK